MWERHTVGRRGFLATAVAACTVATSVGNERQSASDDRARGLLWGGLIGDALGGPVEFRDRAVPLDGLCHARDWQDPQLTPTRREELARTVPLFSYAGIRDAAAPYGPWRTAAPAGTVTDDSRHKMVLIRALRQLPQTDRLTSRHLAQQLLDFQARPQAGDAPDVQTLNEEGFREYRYAARWLLGERDLQTARPVTRLWGGVNNCSGQMMFPPLAVCYPGDPQAAYRAAYELDFIDAPAARDMLAALVAALSEILHPRYDNQSPRDRLAAFRRTLAGTDPYGFEQIPFAGRQLTKWLKLADDLVTRADGRPAELFRLLETDGLPVYWWDAHFTLLVPLTMLRLCEGDPLAALHLTLDFGHDTDSYAQVLGTVIGAVYGESVFPDPMRQAVAAALQNDYEEQVEAWHQTLRDYAARHGSR